MVPSWAKLNDCSVPRAVPSCDRAAALTVSPHCVRGWVALVRSTVTGMLLPLAVAKVKLRLDDALPLAPIGIACAAAIDVAPSNGCTCHDGATGGGPAEPGLTLNFNVMSVALPVA